MTVPIVDGVSPSIIMYIPWNLSNSLNQNLTGGKCVGITKLNSSLKNLLVFPTKQTTVDIVM